MKSPLIAVFLVVALGTAALLQPAATADEHPVYAISGVVRDEQGSPIAGASVSGNVWNDDRRTSGYDHTQTAQDGSYTLKLPAGEGWINAHHAEYHRGDGVTIHIDGDKDGIDLVIPTPPPRDARIEGTVRDAAGNPIAGAAVTLSRSCCDRYDAYDMPEPMVDYGEAPPSGGGTSGSSGTTTASTDPAPPEKEGEPTYSRAMPIYHDEYDWQHVTTDAQGRFAFDTYAGLRQVSAHARDHAQTTIKVEAKSGDTVRADIELVKVPDADAVVKGRVIDAQTGLPVSGAWVNLNNLEWSRHNGTQTGRDGSFEFQTIPGWVQISIQHHDRGMLHEDSSGQPQPAQQSYYNFVETRKVSSGVHAADFQLTPRPMPTIVVTGYVVDPDAKTGVADAHVSFWNQDTSDWGSVVTDKDGSYRILVRAGHHHVNAWAEGHLGGARTFVADGAALRVDIQLPKGEQKWAPCHDCYGHYDGIAYSESADGKAAPMPATRPMAAGDSAETARASGMESGGIDDTQPRSYAGTGGNLGPYDPDAAQGEGDTPASVKAVPGFGLFALAGVGAAAAFAARRQR